MKILSPKEFEELLVSHPNNRYAFFEKYEANNCYYTSELHVTDASECNPKFGATVINNPDVGREEILFDYDWNLDEENTFAYEYWVLEKSDIDEILNLFKSATGIGSEVEG